MKAVNTTVLIISVFITDLLITEHGLYDITVINKVYKFIGNICI